MTGVQTCALPISSFKGIGNQRVKNWFFDNLNQTYVVRVYMRTNTQKNQIEIYFPDKTSTSGVPNKMISYRFDLDCWNPPRDVTNATFATESPIWNGNVANATMPAGQPGNLYANAVAVPGNTVTQYYVGAGNYLNILTGAGGFTATAIGTASSATAASNGV